MSVSNAAGEEVVIPENGLPLLYNTKDSLLNPYFLVRPLSPLDKEGKG